MLFENLTKRSISLEKTPRITIPITAAKIVMPSFAFLDDLFKNNSY